MNAIYFIINTLLSLALFVVLLRLLMQWSRADFRNPLAQAVVRLSNPVIIPLRRVLPPIGRIDTASVVTVVLMALLETGIMYSLRIHELQLPPFISWLSGSVLEILRAVLWIYFYAIVLYALLSMVAPGSYSPMQPLLTSLCEPLLRPVRKLIPPIAALDLSPLWVGIAIQAMLILLH